MQIISTAFLDNEHIPEEYTCGGRNVNPPLTFSEIPKGIKSFVLTVEDIDAPAKPNFTHWLLYNIPSSVMQILDNDVPRGSLQGKNDFGDIGYSGPCPPSGIHHYVFTLSALNTILDASPGMEKEDIKQKMQGHVELTATLTGLYGKP